MCLVEWGDFSAAMFWINHRWKHCKIISQEILEDRIWKSSNNQILVMFRQCFDLFNARNWLNDELVYFG